MKYVIEHIDQSREVSEAIDFEDAMADFCELCDINLELEEGEETRGLTYEGVVVILRPATPIESVEWKMVDGKIALDDYIENMPLSRLDVARARTEKEFGGLIVDWESDEVLDTFAHQLKHLAVSDLVDYFIENGQVTVCGINDEGELLYEAVPQ